MHALARRNPSQTDTAASRAAFRRWFGASKVVDAEGKPLVVYHGTTAGGFDAFRPNYRKGEQLGFGIHFAQDRDFAAKYAEDPTVARKGKTPKVYAVYLSIQRPLVADAIVYEGTPEFALAKKLAGSKLMTQQGEDGVRMAYMQNAIDQTSALRAEKLIREAGYDGILYESVLSTASWTGTGVGRARTGSSRSYIVFEPTQVKSATDNAGTFAPADPSIYRNPMLRNPAKKLSQTNTPAFKRWFGKSKVVDAQGRPRVVYHGTAYAPGQPYITEFRGPHQPYRYPAFTGGKIVGVGSFFSESEEVAASYPYLSLPETQNYTRVVHTLYLRIERPKVYRTVRAAAADMIARTRAERLVHGKETGDPVAFVALLRAEGYDGITFMEGPSYNPTDAKKKARVWIAFDPRQVKSATDNAGTFDLADASNLRNPALRNPQRARALATADTRRYAKIAKDWKERTEEAKVFGASRNLQYLGSGDHRAVFRDGLHPGRVLKLNYDDDTEVEDEYLLPETLTEVRVWETAPAWARSHLVPLLGHDPRGRWAVFEYATPRETPMSEDNLWEREAAAHRRGEPPEQPTEWVGFDPAVAKRLAACGLYDMNAHNLSKDGRVLDYGKVDLERWESCSREMNPMRRNPAEPRYTLLGVDEEVTTCEHCGKADLKCTVVLGVLDADGNVEREARFGRSCAAKALRKPSTTTANKMESLARVAEFKRVWAMRVDGPGKREQVRAGRFPIYVTSYPLTDGRTLLVQDSDPSFRPPAGAWTRLREGAWVGHPAKTNPSRSRGRR